MKSTDGRRIAFSGIDLRFMVDETDGKGEMVMFEMSVLPDARVPIAHHHVAVDEAVYGLEGTLTTTLEGVIHEIGPGDSSSRVARYTITATVMARRPRCSS